MTSGVRRPASGVQNADRAPQPSEPGVQARATRDAGRQASDAPDSAPDTGRRTPAARWRPTFGALPHGGATTFRVWAQAPHSVGLAIEGPDGLTRNLPLERVAAEMFEARVEGAGHGTLYRYVLDDAGPYPDPASRFQPDGVHGPSQVVDWSRYEWSDGTWRGVRFEDLVIYEVHVGTFTRSGSFRGVADRLEYLAHLGVTAIELMPVAAFPGARNWGYDGAALFAPARDYGTPDDLRDLVNDAHRAGIAVLLDVVYNHLGPDGAYLPAFSPRFFSPHHKSPWGDGVNLDDTGCAMVRRFLVENALHWILEYHVDGLRLDATHALSDESDRHFLAELADAVHGLDLGRHAHLIAEDERNLAALVRRPEAGGMGLDGVWADDFHHEMHRLLTGEGEGYYGDYSGRVEDIAASINQGWVYTGQRSACTGRAKGSDPRGVDRQRFVFCLQNHDQVGNRALGERLTHLADLPSCRAAAAVLLMAPETPLIFMGEEWAASTPFQYFTDHHDELGTHVTEGRRREFARFPAFSDPDARRRIPDPQDERTFDTSRLRWDEVTSEPHASMLRLYRALLAARGRDPRLVDGESSRPPAARALDADTIAVTRNNGNGDVLLVARFRAGGRVEVPIPSDSASHAPAERAGPSTRASGSLRAGGTACADRWTVILTTEDPSFAPDPATPDVATTDRSIVVDFARPSAVVLRRRA